VQSRCSQAVAFARDPETASRERRKSFARASQELCRLRKSVARALSASQETPSQRRKSFARASRGLRKSFARASLELREGFAGFARAPETRRARFHRAARRLHRAACATRVEGRAMTRRRMRRTRRDRCAIMHINTHTIHTINIICINTYTDAP
jgi:hypothetical protein